MIELPGVTPEDRRRTPVGLGQRLRGLFFGASRRSITELVLSVTPEAWEQLARGAKRPQFIASKRSRFMTLVQAATKSPTNFCRPSPLA